MSTEDRLRDALRARAASVQPDDGWAQIEQRISHRPPRTKRWIAIGLAALALPGAIAVNAAIQDDDAKPLIVKPGPSTSTTKPTTQVVIPEEMFVYPWREDTAPQFDSPTALAMSFAKDFLGMTEPTVSSYRAGDSTSGEIDVRAFPQGVATTLLVRHQMNKGHWFVVAANSPNLQLDSPTTNETTYPGDHLVGRSVAFEGTVHVTLLSWGYTMQCRLATDTCGAGRIVLADTFFTGHGTELSPFDVPLTFDQGGLREAVLILWTDSARDGSLQEATVRFLRFY